MIDIHCHILPGIDDGAKDLEESLKMARIAVKDGVTTIIATPHCYDGVYDCQQHDIPELCGQLSGVLAEKNIPLQILPGAEVRLGPELLENFNGGRVLTLGDAGRIVLLELPEIFFIEGVLNIIQGLREVDVRCIIAHPERNSLLHNRKEVVKILVNAGAELQLTAGSLLGDFGKEIKLFAEDLLQSEATLYLASDAHCPKRRKPQLKKALKRAGRFMGSADVEKIVNCELSDVSTDVHV